MCFLYVKIFNDFPLLTELKKILTPNLFYGALVCLNHSNTLSSIFSLGLLHLQFPLSAMLSPKYFQMWLFYMCYITELLCDGTPAAKHIPA